MKTKKCDPYGQDGLPLPNKEVDQMMATIDPAWEHKSDTATLVRLFSFDDNAAFSPTGEHAFKFSQTIGNIGMNTGHAPASVTILSATNQVEVRLYTAPLRGLSYNDFLLALKLDQQFIAQKSGVV